MCLGPDAKGEFGVGRRAIRGESREHREGREALVWGAGARLRSLPAFCGARRRRSIEAMSSALASARARKAEKERSAAEEELERGDCRFWR